MKVDPIKGYNTMSTTVSDDRGMQPVGAWVVEAPGSLGHPGHLTVVVSPLMAVLLLL